MPAHKRKRGEDEEQGEDEATPCKKRKIVPMGGYTVLPIRLPHSPFLKYFYCKEHKDKNTSDGRTLFVTNLSFDCTEEDLETIFSTFGKVNSVRLDSFKKSAQRSLVTAKKAKLTMGTTTPGQAKFLEEKKRIEAENEEPEEKDAFERAGYAHVSFEKESALKKLFKHASPAQLAGVQEKGKQTKGLAHMLSVYDEEHSLNQSELKKSLDESLWDFDKKKFEFKRDMEELSSKPDEEGWITVTKKTGKKSGAVGSGVRVGVSTISTHALDAERQAKEKDKQMANFYRFQRSERRGNYLTNLRTRFEQDKKRIEKMKQGRKFKPF